MATSPCSAGESTPTLRKDRKPQVLSPAHYIALCRIQAALTYQPPLPTSHRVCWASAQVLDASLTIPAQKFGAAAAMTSLGSGLQGHQSHMAELSIERRVWAVPSLSHITAPRNGVREVGGGLWRWSRYVTGLCWAEIRHIFNDFQRPFVIHLLALKEKEWVHYSMMVFSLKGGARIKLIPPYYRQSEGSRVTKPADLKRQLCIAHV